MLNVIVTAGWFQTLLLKVPFGDVYLHNPGRMRYLSMIAIPVLGAVGLQGLVDRPMTRHARPVDCWEAASPFSLVLPLVLGAKPDRFILLAVAMLAAVPLLFWLATARKRWAMTAVVVVVGIELLASAVYSGLYQGGTIYTGLEARRAPEPRPAGAAVPRPLRGRLPAADRASSTSSGPSHDRYLTYAPPAASFDKGYLFTQRPQDWPALAMERGTLFGIPDVLGYNPVQLPRYWTYIRATNSNPVFYNAAVIGFPTLQNVRLMGVRYLVVPAGVEAVPEGRVVASADDYDLVQVYGWEPRVSLVHSWTQVDRPADALNGVLDPGFDPARTAYVEQDPGIAPSAGCCAGLGRVSGDHARRRPRHGGHVHARAGRRAEQLRRGVVGDGGRTAGAAARDRLPGARGRGPRRTARGPARLSRRRCDLGHAPRTRRVGHPAGVDPCGAAPGTPVTSSAWPALGGSSPRWCRPVTNASA